MSQKHHVIHHRHSMKQSNFEEEEYKPTINDIVNNPSLSLGAGVAGIFVLLGNRLAFGDIVSDVQSRADIISVIACSALLLNVLSEQDIQTKNRDPVPLVGYALRTPLIKADLPSTLSSSLEWCIQTILKTTPVTSVHVINKTDFLAKGGVVGMKDDRINFAVNNIERMTILQKTLKVNEETYLPDLQILPGKAEFDYLPINCQSVLILPVNNGAVIMSTNQAKVLKLKDLNRIRSLVAIFRNLMSSSQF